MDLLTCDKADEALLFLSLLFNYGRIGLRRFSVFAILMGGKETMKTGMQGL